MFGKKNKEKENPEQKASEEYSVRMRKKLIIGLSAVAVVFILLITGVLVNGRENGSFASRDALGNGYGTEFSFKELVSSFVNSFKVDKKTDDKAETSKVEEKAAASKAAAPKEVSENVVSENTAVVSNVPYVSDMQRYYDASSAASSSSSAKAEEYRKALAASSSSEALERAKRKKKSSSAKVVQADSVTPAANPTPVTAPVLTIGAANTNAAAVVAPTDNNTAAADANNDTSTTQVDNGDAQVVSDNPVVEAPDADAPDNDDSGED